MQWVHSCELDDFVRIGVPSIMHASYHFLLALLKRLGLDITEMKLVQPGTKAICLGVDIDTVEFTINSTRKITEYCKKCQ